MIILVCLYIAIILMGIESAEVAFYAYIIPFLISTAAGAVLSAIVVESLKKSKVIKVRST